MPLQVSSTVRFAALRSRCLSFAKTCSIGLRSGLYAGRSVSLAPTARMASRTAFPLWLGRLSRITISPGRKVGMRHCSTQARKLLALIGWSKT
jgi:hypothetical protein